MPDETLFDGNPDSLKDFNVPALFDGMQDDALFDGHPKGGGPPL